MDRNLTLYQIEGEVGGFPQAELDRYADRFLIATPEKSLKKDVNTKLMLKELPVGGVANGKILPVITSNKMDVTHDTATDVRTFNHTLDVEPSIYAALDPNLRTVDPRKVGTLVIVTTDYQDEGWRYTNGIVASRRKWTVTVVNNESGAMVGQQVFLGGDPPSSIGRNDGGIGSEPSSSAIAEFVEDLQAKSIVQ